MEIPLFNYSSEVIQDPQIKKLSKTTTPMWMLHHKIYYAVNLNTLKSDHFEAMINFRCWQMRFEENCGKALNEHYRSLNKQEKKTSDEVIIQCLLFAELQDWKIFLRPEAIDYSSFFAWTSNDLVYTRALSCLLQHEPVPKFNMNNN